MGNVQTAVAMMVRQFLQQERASASPLTDLGGVLPGRGYRHSADGQAYQGADTQCPSKRHKDKKRQPPRGEVTKRGKGRSRDEQKRRKHRVQRYPSSSSDDSLDSHDWQPAHGRSRHGRQHHHRADTYCSDESSSTSGSDSRFAAAWRAVAGTHGPRRLNVMDPPGPPDGGRGMGVRVDLPNACAPSATLRKNPCETGDPDETETDPDTEPPVQVKREPTLGDC
jgi:hypothetical protein